MIKTEQDRFYMLLGSLIREHRVNANLKQETFASFLKLSRASIVNIEKGRQHPSMHLIFEIANVLNIHVSELLPSFEVEDKVNHQWKKIIANKSKDKESKAKILGFIEEIQSI
jgi:DNA-binding XRE family transcriptional regulator